MVAAWILASTVALSAPTQPPGPTTAPTAADVLYSPPIGDRVRLTGAQEIEIPGLLRYGAASGAILDPEATVVRSDDKVLTIQTRDGAQPITVPRPGSIWTATLVALEDEWIVVTRNGVADGLRIPRSTLAGIAVGERGGWTELPAGPPRLVLGDHVRISTAAGAAGTASTRDGRLVAIGADTLQLTADDTGSPLTVPRTEIVLLAVERAGRWFVASRERSPVTRPAPIVLTLRPGDRMRIQAEPWVEIAGWVKLHDNRFSLDAGIEQERTVSDDSVLAMRKAGAAETVACPRPGKSLTGILVDVSDTHWRLLREIQMTVIQVPRASGLAPQVERQGEWLPLVDAPRFERAASLAVWPGARVRIATQATVGHPAQTLRGSVSALSGTEITIRPERTTDEISVPIASVSRLDLSRHHLGRQRRSLVYAAGGAASGALMGVLLNLAAGDSPNRSPLPVVATGAGLGCAFGALHGLLRGEDWRPVPLPHASAYHRAGPTPSFQATVRLGF